jgi:zinc finger HIT domain-containing protein 1
MNNFGVQEVANSRSIAAPGWAYVPDTGVNASVAALQPSSRKRARKQPSASHHETTAKQDAKILRELAALDRENHRDVSIPVPIRHRDNAGRGKILVHIYHFKHTTREFC